MRSALPFLALLLFACSSSDDTGATDAGGASTSSSGGSSGTASSSGGSSSGNVSGGCPAISIGPSSGTVVKSVPRGTNAKPWTDVDNAKATDGTFAKVVLGAGEESEELQITGFDFQLPEGAVFQGVEAELVRQAPDLGIVDGAIALIGVKDQVGRGKFIATPWPNTIVGTHHYGQSTDTWGMDLNPPDVETSDFGVSLWVKRDATGPAEATALVDAIRIRVAYCMP